MTTEATPPTGMLHVTDSRTGRSYDLPIADGAIRAIDLRQIRASDDDFGLLSYDPAFMNTASCRSCDHLHRRGEGHPAVPRLPDRGTRRTGVLPRRGLPAAARGAAPGSRPRRRWADEIIQHTFVHENVKKFIDGFHHDAHPMGILVSSIAALSTFYPGAKDISDSGAPASAGSAADREDPDAGGVRLPARAGTAVRLPGRRALLHREPAQHDVEDDRAPVSPGPGARPRAGRAVHAARRPRAELLDQRDAGGRQLAGRSVLGRGGRGGGAVRAAARGGERAGPADAAGHRLGGRACPATSIG